MNVFSKLTLMSSPDFVLSLLDDMMMNESVMLMYRCRCVVDSEV